MKRNATVDAYIEGLETFQSEAVRLRGILNSTGLTEEVKWGGPAYTYDGKILVGIGVFKKHFALWFHQGALLEDAEGVLMTASGGKTKALKQWRFTSAKEIKVRLIKAYVKEAIELVDAGRAIKPERGKPVSLPPELKAALAASTDASKAFGALSLGKRREYAGYIAEAKRDETKARRIEKTLPMIRAGLGLNDKYRNG